MPIPLPDASGREQILAIHLRSAREAGLVSGDVDDASLAARTDGFSGADLAGLVRSATSFALADWRRKRDAATDDTAGDADGGGGGGGGDHARVSADGGVVDVNGDAIGDADVESGSVRDSGRDAAERSGSGGGDGGLAVEITSENLEQALREVGASGGGGRRRGRFRGLGVVGAAFRNGLGRVSPTPRGDGG